MLYMDPSPGNRIIESVEGTPSTISERGNDIQTLGQQMLDSADLLESIATRAAGEGQVGKAIDALKESIDDAYTTLRQAGQLYEPVGPVIRKYGDELDRIQTPLNTSAADCQELWDAFIALPGEDPREGMGGSSGPELEVGSPEAEAQQEADDEKQAAYDAFRLEAGTFDTWAHAWETAYDEAVGQIEEKMADQIEDSLWSKFADVLGFVAFALGIAALIFGGPLLVALAALAGVLLLVATIGQYANGEASLSDIGLAALGVFPFGKVTSLSKLAHGTKFGTKGFGKTVTGSFSDLKGLKSMPSIGSDSLVGLYRSGGWKSVGKQLGLGNQGYKAVKMEHYKLYRGVGNMPSLMNNLGRVRGAAALDFGAQAIGNVLKYNAWSGRVGGPSVEVDPRVDVIL